jgi:hypothetical protein
MPSRAALPIFVPTLALGALMLGSAAQAAPPALNASRAAVAQAIADCRKVADKDARLSCYDQAADAFEQAQAEGQVVVVDRAQVREVKRQAFGLSLPSLNLFPKSAKEPGIDRVSVKLSGAHPDPTGKWVMITDEGAVWTQIDSQELLNDPHAGSTVAIRRASLGSFFCNVDGQSAIRCARNR